MTTEGNAQQPSEATEQEIHVLLRGVLSVANRSDYWLDYGSESGPYLTAKGCALVQKAYCIDSRGLSWDPPDNIGEVDANGDPIIVYTLNAEFEHVDRNGRPHSVHVSANASTDMKQIMSQRVTRERTDKGSGKKIKYQQLSRGEAIGRAKDMARARCFHRGIVLVLGIPGITWDDLADHGIKREECTRVGEYSGGKGGGSRGSGGGNLRPKHPDDDFHWKIYKGEIDGLTRDMLFETMKQHIGDTSLRDLRSKPVAAVTASANALRAMLRGGSQDRGSQGGGYQGGGYGRGNNNGGGYGGGGYGGGNPPQSAGGSAPAGGFSRATPAQIAEIREMQKILKWSDAQLSSAQREAGRHPGAHLSTEVAAEVQERMRSEIEGGAPQGDPGFGDDDLPM